MTVCDHEFHSVTSAIPKVVTVSGSWNSPSKTRVLTDAVIASLQARLPIDVTRIDLAEIGSEIAQLTDISKAGRNVCSLFSAVASADLLIVGSPIYKAAYTGQFKHFFDLMDPRALVDTPVKSRLFPDMAPFHFQIEALKNHAVWGMEAAKTGMFVPPPLVGAMPFAELRAMIGDAITALEAFAPDEVNSWCCKTLNIEIFQPLDVDSATTSNWVPRKLVFTPETFLLSYSLPNFYFHVVTAYNILRTRGVPLGKYHYQGQLRTRPL